jgi:carbon-monoxide dehydrogenase small subunit
MEKYVTLIINGKRKKVKARAADRLLDVLRWNLSLTGTKEGCGEGECGACSIVLNDEVVDSCLILFGQLSDGDEITTIEGIGGKKRLHPLQEHFLDCGAAQCGSCTPGMIMAAYALLKKNPKPTREEIREAVAGNLCRCTGYTKIIEAIEKCSKGK